MITYLLPTHNRPERLRLTLNELASLDSAPHDAMGGAEVIIVDNASDPPVEAPRKLKNGFRIRKVRCEANYGAAARNLGVQQARSEWIIMLDDDSFPLDCNHLQLLAGVEEDVAAIGADIFLTDATREAGGLPEVFTGCGVALRRKAFIEAGGYDPSFDYYAEEYDLCAKLLLNGWRIVHDVRFRVRHEKIGDGRDMNRILHRLVRNNAWVAQRYAPDDGGTRWSQLAETISRYARIAIKERAACGYSEGVAEMLQTLKCQSRREMTQTLFDRFTGLSHVRETISTLNGQAVAIVEEGKNAWAIRQSLRERGIRVVKSQKDADVLLVGSLSPGPMLDAFERCGSGNQLVIMPWQPRGRVSQTC